MRSVRLGARVDALDPDTVFDRIVDFERYPDLVSTVKSVEVDRSSDEGAPVSDWEVYFRNGILRWQEVDQLDRDALTVTFDQTTGDFDVFRGSWVLTPEDGSTSIVFDAEFDFGVPSLASIIDPVAVRVLTETISATLEGLFDGVCFDTDPGAGPRPLAAVG